MRKNDKLVGIFVIARDSTEKKQMEQKLEYSQHLEEIVEKRTRELKEAHENLLKVKGLQPSEK